MNVFSDIDITQLDLKAQLRAIECYEHEESLYAFLKDAWRYIDASPWKDSWAVGAMAEHLEAVCDGQIRRLIINIPPRHGKSSLVSVAFPAWTWAQKGQTPTSGAGVQFLSSSYATQLALRDSVKSRRLIESAWYQGYWRDRFSLNSDQNTKSRFSNDRGGERLITSVGAGVTGEGGNIILIDDPNSASEAFSEAKIQETIDWWTNAMSTRLNDQATGAYVIIQQRLAENDLTGHILEHEGADWTHLCLPMRYEPDRAFMTPLGWKDPRSVPGELLSPDRFDETAVRSLEKTLGKYQAAGQLQQRPEPAGGGVIKREHWQLWEEKTFPPMDYILASLDTAYTSRTENDPSAMTVWGVFTADDRAKAGRTIGADGKPVYFDRVYDEQAPKLMLMGAWSEHLEFYDLIKKVEKTCKLLKVDKLLVENKAAGISLTQEMRRLFGSADFGIQLSDPKSLDKLARLFSIQHIFEEGVVYAPDKAWSEMVITQVGQFPRGRRDDLVDCTSMAIRHLRDVGLLTRAPERLEEIAGMTTYSGGRQAPLYPA